MKAAIQEATKAAILVSLLGISLLGQAQIRRATKFKGPQKAYERDLHLSPGILVEARFESIRSEPRFLAIVKENGA